MSLLSIWIFCFHKVSALLLKLSWFITKILGKLEIIWAHLETNAENKLLLQSVYLHTYIQFSSVAQSCLTLRSHESQHARPPCITNSRSSPKLMCIESVMPSSHLIFLKSPSPAPNPSQHQGLFQWVNTSHEVAKVLELQLQHQSFQWTPRTDLL